MEENMVGQVNEPEQNYDLMTMLMICLGQPEDTDCDILKLLDVLLSNEINVEDVIWVRRLSARASLKGEQKAG